jgi:hypothetical protein
MVEAIKMFDQPIHQSLVDMLDGYDEPPGVMCYNYTNTTMSALNTTDWRPTVPYRQEYHMKMFKYSRADMLVKISIKAILTHSTRYLIGWATENGYSTDNTVYFEWSPSEMNTIYLLFPWTSPYPMLPVTEFNNTILGDRTKLFGFLYVRQIGGAKDKVIENVAVNNCLVNVRNYIRSPIKKSS